MSLVAVAVLLLVSAAPAEDAKKETDTNLGNYTGLAAAIARADVVTVYEGLPHQAHEKDLLEKELKAKKTVQFHGFPFYAEPLAVRAEDAKALTALAADPKSVQKWAGVKRCGGFHPDYAVEWKAGADTYRVLVCFGCHELKFFGPKSELYCDMSDAGLHGLEKLLKPLRKNRPKAE